jgi:hypothetical protein
MCSSAGIIVIGREGMERDASDDVDRRFNGPEVGARR